MRTSHAAPKSARRASACLLTLSLSAVLGCGGDPSARIGATGAITPLERNVRWGRALTLEENRAVVNVTIHVAPDPRGGFLVADNQEDQVRRYDPLGRLVEAFGKRGPGPREFTYLLTAQRRSDGEVVALDGLSHAAVFDSAGAELVRTFRVPVEQVKFATLVNDTLLLVGGQRLADRGADPDERLHLWNLRTGTLARSFFPVHPSTAGHRFAANTAGILGAAARGDTIAAVFALSDSVYLFDLRGRRLSAVPIPSAGLRRFDPDMSPPHADIVSAREWFGRFSLVSNVWWTRDGGFVVQYQDRVGVEPHWRLVRMTRDGRRLFESTETPHLLAVDAAADTLWFVKPSSPTPNEWVAATFRG